MAAGVLYFIYMKGSQNPADLLTKFLPYPTFWPLIEPLLFWKGETIKEEDKHLHLLGVATLAKGSDKTQVGLVGLV